MSKTLTLILLAVVLPGMGQEGNKTFMARLTGNQMVMPVQTGAVGHAKFSLKQDGKSLHYRLRVENLRDVTMAHVHLAPAGSDGPRVVSLYPGGPQPVVKRGKFSGVLAKGTITEMDLLDTLQGKPLSSFIEDMEKGWVYVNIHTKRHPQGELRGQLEISTSQ